MVSTERGAAIMLLRSLPITPGTPTSPADQPGGAETRTPDSTMSLGGNPIGIIVVNTGQLPRGNDTHPDRGNTFLILNLSQSSSAAAAGQVHKYMMIGTGQSGAAHSWVVSDNPDFTAAFYTGGDTPIINAYVTAHWIA